MLEKLKQKRDEELKKIRMGRILEVVMFSLNDIIPMTSSIATLTVYVSLTRTTVLDGQMLITDLRTDDCYERRFETYA